MHDKLKLDIPYLNILAILSNEKLIYKMILKLKFTVSQVGMRSHLFITKTRCLYGQFFFKWSSTCLERVPIGLRASKIYTTTSEESNTL